LRIAVLGTRGVPEVMGGVETHCQELYRVLPAVVRELRRFVRDDLSLGEHRLDKMSLFLDRNL
jgi:hypothetical protein